MRLLLTVAIIFTAIPLSLAQRLPEPSQRMLEQAARLQAKEIPLTDYHIHIRGGMTPEKALDWTKKTGIRSGVLENHGKGWPLSDNAKLKAFIEDAQRFPELLIGIQVNDRDWFKVIDPALRAKLDYILADTMIMDGQKLWAENEYDTTNENAWLERYFAHCMTVVNEPITILANPTYLPNKIKHRYDDFWTEERMGMLIDAAVKNKVALEIQSDTQFPNKKFIELAMQKGAKITIGRNNSDDKPNELKRSLDWLEELNVKPENMLHLKTAAERNSAFWFLEPGVEPTAENRIAAIQNVGGGLLDFAIYQPTGTFPEEYRQKLLDAGFVFDFLTEEQLEKTVHDWAAYHLSPVGQVSILVIPEGISLPIKEIERLRTLRLAFLGKAPELPESRQENFTSLANRKNVLEAEYKRMRDSIVASPYFAGREEEEIDAIIQRMPPSPRIPSCSGMDEIGDNLAEAVGLFFDRARAFAEEFVEETGVKLLARRTLMPGGRVNTSDVFYIFANTKENAQSIDGWFRLRELVGGRTLATYSLANGGGGAVIAKNDRAFFMDSVSGRIGEAAVRGVPDSGVRELRIQMQPGETLIVRIVRERVKPGSGLPAGGGFGEFEPLPAWEYEGTIE